MVGKSFDSLHHVCFLVPFVATRNRHKIMHARVFAFCDPADLIPDLKIVIRENRISGSQFLTCSVAACGVCNQDSQCESTLLEAFVFTLQHRWVVMLSYFRPRIIGRSSRREAVSRRSRRIYHSGE